MANITMSGFTPFQVIPSCDAGNNGPYTANAQGVAVITGPRDVAALLNAGYCLNGDQQVSMLPLSASGAVPVAPSATYIITKAGVAALTLAAPTAGSGDGTKLTITSNTAFAHTLTATGLLQTGTATVNLSTFAAFAGASITLVAYQGKWNVVSNVATVLT